MFMYLLPVAKSTKTITLWHKRKERDQRERSEREEASKYQFRIAIDTSPLNKLPVVKCTKDNV